MKLETSQVTLHEKFPYSELFWSIFSGIWAEYKNILCICPYSVRIRVNTDQNNSKYLHFFTQCNMWDILNYWIWRQVTISQSPLPRYNFSHPKSVTLYYFFLHLLLLYYNFSGILAIWSKKKFYRLLKTKDNSIRCYPKRIFFWAILFINKLRETRLYLIRALILK